MSSVLTFFLLLGFFLLICRSSLYILEKLTVCDVNHKYFSKVVAYPLVLFMIASTVQKFEKKGFFGVKFFKLLFYDF